MNRPWAVRAFDALRRQGCRAAAALALLAACMAPAGAAPGLTLHVGVYENAPKIFTTTDGKPAGIMVELLEAMAEREQWQLVFQRCAWQECLRQLEAGSLDLLPDVAYNAERERRFDFHRTPALHSWSQIYRRDGVAIESILDLRDKRVALLGGSIQQQGLEALLKGFDVPITLSKVDSVDAAFALVAAGKADAAVASHQFGAFKARSYRLVETPIVFMPSSLFYAAGQGRHAEVLQRIDAHLEDWQHDTGSLYFLTIRKWGGQAPEAFIPGPARTLLAALAAIGLVLTGGVLLLRQQVAAKTRELANVNRQLEVTLQAIPDLMFEVDSDGRYVAVHAVRPDQLAAPASTLVGRTVAEVLPPEAAAGCMAALREAVQDGYSAGQQILLPLQPEPRWFELSVARKPDDGSGGPAHFIVLSRDITPRKRAEARVQRLGRLYETLSHCNQAVAQCRTEAELLQRVCHDAVYFGGLVMAWIGELDADGRLQPIASHGEGLEYLDGLEISIRADVPTGRGTSGIAMREDRPVWSQDFSTDPMSLPWRERAVRFGWAGVASLPLHRRGQVCGAMALYAREKGAFDADAQALLVQMAADIDAGIERFRQAAERERLAEAIKLSEAKYRELTETIKDVIWTLDPYTLRFLYVSPSVLRLRGCTPEEVMAEPMDAALTPEGSARVRAAIARNLAEFEAGRRGPHDVNVDEIEQPRKDGTTVWTEVVTNYARNPRSGRVELRGVTRDISERKKAEAQIRQLAMFDQLTGLPNRAHLKERFDYALNLAEHHGQPLAVVFLDIDRFKDINDSLGHDVGDQLLVEVARRLAEGMRASDTVSRLGGDEFILVLPQTDADGAARTATRLLQAIARPVRLGSHELRTSTSIGIAMYPEDGTDIDTLSRCADAAMYQVKRDSRNGYRFFTAEMQVRSARTLQLSTALHEALDRGQLSLHFQPQLALADGRVIGAEALLRWQHPQLGWISPGEFIAIAESNGLILPIGEWVLREAAAQARDWMERGLPPLVVAVNVSAAQFRQAHLPELVSRIATEAGIATTQLGLELTEAAAMNNPRAAVAMLDDLAGRGLHLSIDDFGTGYSSLSYLKRFKVHVLKIDQSFVRDLGADPEDQQIVIAIIKLAHSLGMRTLAEGVETAAQLEFLRCQGCDEVQGYYFGRPMPAAEFEAWLQRHANAERPAEAAELVAEGAAEGSGRRGP
ncbi:Bifunctional diguanylate cyclase/phosphodiesterase [Rubrivivax sp. A210]|uniref:EAL domain-containing protein n=1 Tax=Rubrivivax sp. A210 TaxID=2772301 RepID=UPI001919BFC1|nr:EAL domain-containing protein [Rubrivivax sp. A210]CAD5375177.1 Bifunctional diguanylate cyclase/phosphodiesterase [Rubrivivax sp. A210]